eukprot:2232570-Rhodomonas_salina.2
MQHALDSSQSLSSVSAQASRPTCYWLLGVCRRSTRARSSRSPCALSLVVVVVVRRRVVRGLRFGEVRSSRRGSRKYSRQSPLTANRQSSARAQGYP